MVIQLVMLVLGTLLQVTWLVGHPLSEYRLDRFDKSPRVNYKNLGKAALYSTTWKTVVYFSSRTVTDQLSARDDYVGYVNRLCTKVDLRSWTACNHLNELTTSRLCQARDSAKLIFSFVGRESESNRNKRGLFDFVGKVSKILFGTMDGDDTQYYNMNRLSTLNAV
jgi:hypothetical protein